MKKLLLAFILSLLSTQAFAISTWYIRPAGAAYGTTSTTCNGHTDADYVTNTGPNCAVKDPYQIRLYSTDDSGGTAGTERVSAGDTVIFHDNGTTHFPIGYNISSPQSGCSASYPYGCYLMPWPNNVTLAGSNYTSGCATKAQLYGTQAVKKVVNLESSSGVTLSCLEITDHSACLNSIGGNQCSKTYTGDVGNWGYWGVYAKSVSNLTMTDVDIHGMADRGMIGAITGMTLTRVNFDGNGWAGWDWDDTAYGGTGHPGGTITAHYPKTRFNGCSETYPRSTSFSTSDYSGCVDQNASGYGDGWGGLPWQDGSVVKIDHGEWSHNVQDGLDFLYMSDNFNTQSVSIDKSLFEGNDGNQLKFSAKNMELDNSILIANCTYHTQTGKVYNTGSWSDCRANGTPISATALTGATWKFFNNSAITATGSSGSAFIELNPRNADTGVGNTYTFSNNVLKNYNNTWTAYYNGLSGASQTAFAAATSNHSDIYNFTSAPSGTGVVTTDPQWGGSFSVTADSNVSAIALSSSSPAKGNGSSNTFWNNSKDYNDAAQNSPIDQGSVIYGSACTPNCTGAVCGASDGCGGQCSSGSCTAPNTCGGGGTANTCGCTGSNSCAANTCSTTTCTDSCGNHYTGTMICGTKSIKVTGTCQLTGTISL